MLDIVCIRQNTIFVLGATDQNWTKFTHFYVRD